METGIDLDFKKVVLHEAPAGNIIVIVVDSEGNEEQYELTNFSPAVATRLLTLFRVSPRQRVTILDLIFTPESELDYLLASAPPGDILYPATWEIEQVRRWQWR